VNHGEAVAIGMSLIAHASVRCDVLTLDDALRIDGVLERLGFELQSPVELSQVLGAVKLDKKRENDVLRVVLPVMIGKSEVVELSLEEFNNLFIG
jgi:3-dehydroquinate synthase